jgi:flagellar hook-associated protein 3 FlgL
MLSGLDVQTQRFLSDLGHIARRLQQAQVRVSSGLQMQQASDAPGDVTRLLYLRSLHDFTVQLRGNLGRVQSEVNAGELALRNAVTVVERVSVLGTQAATDFVTAGQRAGIAVEVESLMRDLTNLAATQTEGRYIFSGDADATVPYTLDLTQPYPFSLYQGAASSRDAMHPAGTRFGIALTAQGIFDDPDPSRSVFQAVNNLRVALQNDDSDAINQSLAVLKGAETHLNNQLAYYGALQNQVGAAVEFAQQQELRLKTEISGLEDADLAKEILEMNQARLNQEAALQSQSRMRRISLFDYLG